MALLVWQPWRRWGGGTNLIIQVSLEVVLCQLNTIERAAVKLRGLVGKVMKQTVQHVLQLLSCRNNQQEIG